MNKIFYLITGLVASNLTTSEVLAQSNSTVNLEALVKQVAEQQKIIEAQQAQINRLVEKVEGTKLDPSSKTASATHLTNTATTVASTTATPSSSAELKTQPSLGTSYEGVKVTLGGAIRTTALGTTGRAMPDGSPFFMMQNIPGAPQTKFKIDTRPSNVYLNIDGMMIGNYKASGLILASFSNGDLLSGRYGLTPLQAWGELRNEKERYAIGLLEDVFSPRYPSMVDTVSALAGSGNPGNTFRPQMRAERIIPLAKNQSISGVVALSDPTPTSFNINNSNINNSNITENSGSPNLEGRILWTQGEAGSSWIPWPGIEVGASGVVGKFRTVFAADSKTYTTNLWGVSLDWRFKAGNQFGFQGEVYKGNALGTYLGGMFHTINANSGLAIPSVGGWAEAVWYWSPTMHSHLGYGLDTVDRSALLTGATGNEMGRNQTAYLSSIWDFTKMTQFAVETTWRSTNYLTSTYNNKGFGLMLAVQQRF